MSVCAVRGDRAPASPPGCMRLLHAAPCMFYGPMRAHAQSLAVQTHPCCDVGAHDARHPDEQRGKRRGPRQESSARCKVQRPIHDGSGHHECRREAHGWGRWAGERVRDSTARNSSDGRSVGRAATETRARRRPPAHGVAPAPAAGRHHGYDRNVAAARPLAPPFSRGSAGPTIWGLSSVPTLVLQPSV